MAVDVRKFALQLKVIEILERHCRARRRLHIFRQWKKLYLHRN